MSLTVFTIVILAALLHVSWNAMVKHGSDKFLSMSCVIFGHMLFGFAALFFVPLPDVASWPYVLFGLCCIQAINYFYCIRIELAT